MGTPFVALLEPSYLGGYRRGKPHDEQPDGIPKEFCDAMEVREAVFVREQNVPIENEFDADDSRACHWVVYASINKKPEGDCSDGAGNTARRSSARSVPIGTIRLVPFPHDPHPQDGGVYLNGKLQEIRKAAKSAVEKNDATEVTEVTEATEATEATEVTGAAEYVGAEKRSSEKLVMPSDHATELHDGKEPYVKLGRLAVDKAFRGLHTAHLLVSTALGWLMHRPSYFDPNIKEMGLERIGASKVEDVPLWQGLVCVHAQKEVVGVWEKFGFQVDEGMGSWWEEGIEHKGMFMRVKVTDHTLTPSIM